MKTRAFDALSFEEEKHTVLAMLHLAEATRCRQLKLVSSQSCGDCQVLLGGVEELREQLSTKASEELFADREVMHAFVSVAGDLLWLCSAELRGDVDLVSAAVRGCGEAWLHLGDRILQDRDALLAVVRENSLALQFASPAQQDDKELVLAALTQSNWGFDFASDRLRSDFEVVKAVLRTELPSDPTRESALMVAGDAVRADKATMLEAIASKAWALEAASKALKGDREVVLTALRNQTEVDAGCRRANVLVEASEELRADSEVVLEAVRVQGAAVELASPMLRQNKDFVLQAARRAPIGQGSHCYEKADDLVHQSVSLDEFLGASECKLAIAGDSYPVLTVALETASPFSHRSSKSNPTDVIACRVSLLSGVTFTCSLQVSHDLASLPITTQTAGGPSPGSLTFFSGPAQKRARLSMSGEQVPAAMTVADLAAMLVNELPNHTQVRPPPARIFIIFSKDGEPESPITVTPWDWNRPISEFV